MGADTRDVAEAFKGTGPKPSPQSVSRSATWRWPARTIAVAQARAKGGPCQYGWTGASPSGRTPRRAAALWRPALTGACPVAAASPKTGMLP